jgi:putative addiction module CopG family antidote
MKVDLSRSATAFVKRKVRTGAFVSEADVISEALRLMRLRDVELDDLRTKAAKGFKSLDQGRSIDMTDERWTRIKMEGRKRLAQMRRRKAA